MKALFLRFAPLFLLGFAWALEGAKTNGQFTVWAAGALLYCFFATSKMALNQSKLATPLLLLTLILLVQMDSLDFQRSFFWSFELAVFVILWPSFGIKGVQDITMPGGLFLYESLLAISVIATIRQMQLNSPAYGYLPINPNFNAAWMTLGAVFLAAKQVQVISKNSFQKGVEIILILVLTMLVVFGHSRSGLIAMVIGFEYIAWHSLPRKWFLAIIAGTIAISLLIMNSWLQTRFGLLAQTGLRADRLQFWAIALRAISCRPLTGYGLGNFEIAYNQFAFPVFDDLVRYAHTTEFAHNEFLQLLTEMGLPAGGFFILIIGSPLLAPIRQDHPFDLPAKASLFILGAMSMVNPILHMPLLVYLGLMMASVLTRGRKKGVGNPALPYFFHDLPAKSLYKCILAGLIFLSCYFFASSYWSAQKDWKQLIAINPHNAEAWHQLGNQEVDNSERIEAQRHAVRQAPYNLYYREGLATELESSGLEANYPMALQQYQQAVILCPTRAVDALALGRLLLRAGDPQAALVWFEKARALEPDYWESDLWIARCYRASGQQDKATFILHNLLARHAQAKLPDNLFGISPYEHAILGFDEQVVKRELK